jgi:hypothetical protein
VIWCSGFKHQLIFVLCHHSGVLGSTPELVNFFGFPMVSLGKKEKKRRGKEKKERKRGRIWGVLTSLSLTILYKQK